MRPGSRAAQSLAADDGGAIQQTLARLAPATASQLPQQISLRRGTATVPLAGVDVPFHSSLLRPRMAAFRRVLQESLDLERVRPQRLVGKYVPNVTGAPFDISRAYIEEVWRATGSEKLGEVLGDCELPPADCY